jgi:hypothetical protein
MNETDKVHIFLVDDDNTDTFLSIQKQDIQRLSVYPHKWFKFIMFAICGARGKLSVELKGPAVQDDVGFADICASYYYTPDGETSHGPANKTNLCFVDYHAVNDRFTSTAKTRRAIDFRQKILRREEHCV